jgi:hypothetical protein
MLSLRSIGQVWFWSRDCRPVSDTRWVGQDLAIGTHLVTSRRGYTHHGIYVGRGMVVHYAGLSRFLRSGPIEEVTIRRFSTGRTVRIARYTESIFSPNEIVQRARSRIGENQYHVLRNNCEHFCHWCMTGRSRSRQVEGPLTIALQGLVAAANWAKQLRLNLGTLCTMLGRGVSARRPLHLRVRTFGERCL